MDTHPANARASETPNSDSLGNNVASERRVWHVHLSCLSPEHTPRHIYTDTNRHKQTHTRTITHADVGVVFPFLGLTPQNGPCGLYLCVSLLSPLLRKLGYILSSLSLMRWGGPIDMVILIHLWYHRYAAWRGLVGQWGSIKGVWSSIRVYTCVTYYARLENMPYSTLTMAMDMVRDIRFRSEFGSEISWTPEGHRSGLE